MFNDLIWIIIVPIVVLVVIIVGVVVLVVNRSNSGSADPNNPKPKPSAKDFFLNLGAFIALYTLVGSLLNLLFSVINEAYPKVSDYYYGNPSISWPVATLIVVFPIFVLLMWFLEREYRTEPERQTSGIHRGLTYVTLFISGLVLAGDLITVVYYFIDGQELTTGFLLKVLVLFVVALSLFVYYISDLRQKLTPRARIAWRIFAGVIILGSIVWGFSVIGSPRNQRLLNYDEQKVNDLVEIKYAVEEYYRDSGVLPENFEQISSSSYFYGSITDPQTQEPYEYEKTSSTTYSLCAEFNKDADENSFSDYGYRNNKEWAHPSGDHCFALKIDPKIYDPDFLTR